MTRRNTTSTHTDSALLVQLAEQKAMLASMQDMLRTNHEHTQERLKDLKESMNQRVEGLSSRVTRLEEGERKIIWKVSGLGSLAGAISAGAVLAIKHMAK